MATKTIIFLIAMAIGSTVAHCNFDDKCQNIPDSNATINIITQDPYQFRYLPANRQGCFSFLVKAKKSVHISLSNAAIYGDPKITIIISGWADGNTSAVAVDDNYALARVKTHTPGFLKEDEYRGFWVRWSQHGDIFVGKINSLHAFIVYRHPIEKWFPINFVGVANSPNQQIKADWLIDEDPSCPYGLHLKP